MAGLTDPKARWPDGPMLSHCKSVLLKPPGLTCHEPDAAALQSLPSFFLENLLPVKSLIMLLNLLEFVIY